MNESAEPLFRILDELNAGIRLAKFHFDRREKKEEALREWAERAQSALDSFHEQDAVRFFHD